LGGVMGLFAGTITIGFTLTALGFFHGPHELMGYQGYGRARGQSGVMEQVGPTLWAPVDKWTNELYEWMSVSTLYPNIGSSPLKHYNPELYKQASLLRDNVNEGEGQISMPKNGVVVDSLFHPETEPYFVVKARFNREAMDFGRQLVLASSQIRLVGKASGSEQADILHPIIWAQMLPENSIAPTPFSFDDRQNYATSIPGQTDVKEMYFIFKTSDEDFVPEYVQVRGTRFSLPEVETFPGGIAMLMNVGSGDVDTRRLGGNIEPDYFQVMDRVPGFRPSLNTIPGTMQMIDGKFADGFLRMQKSAPGTTSQSLQADGVYSMPGTAIVYVDVSRNSPVFLGGQVDERAGDGDEIALLDSYGNKYTPIGYVYKFGTEVEIKLDPRNGIKTVRELPILSRSQEQDLLLVFQVTGGVKVNMMRVGHTLLGTTEIDIPAR
ncbi:MAG: hypothetical protein MK095_09190, partial [Phycisphaerales bacterium]|nr:hypothetical protein [Phycisphaerales bacterium]